MSYLAMIPHRACGIPCLIGVTYFVRQPPLGPSADSDMDCYGYTSSDWVLLDTRKRKAGWLERKMTDHDRAAAYEAIDEHFSRIRMEAA